MLTRRRFLQLASGFLTLSFGTAAYGMVIEPGLRLALAQWRVAHRHWPAPMPSLRIAVLTDIHAIEPWMPMSRIERIVAAANALKPDLTVLLGDYVDSMPSFRTGIVPISDWAPALGQLRAPLGVFAVLGNHDWWKDPDGVRDGLSRAGIRVLENQAVKLGNSEQRFWLAGLGDQLALRARRGHVGVDDLPKTLAPAENDRDPFILLAHEPDIFVDVPERVTLTLSGHTHGGQVRLPFIGRPVIPSRYGQRFAYGHIVENGRHLIVSSGLGMTAVPVRFMVPPEIALVTIGSAMPSKES